MSGQLPYNVKYDVTGHFNLAMPWRLTKKRSPRAVPNGLQFSITNYDYMLLTDTYGEGRCYAYLEDFNKWCEIRVYRWWVVNFFVITDKDKIKELEEGVTS